MPTVTLRFKENVLGRFPIQKGRSLTIGRRRDNDIVIDNLAVSGHHAKLDSVGEDFVLVDLQSKNGTFVNERMVSTHWLKNGDAISIGKHLLIFDAAEEAPPARKASKIDNTMIMDTTVYRSMKQKSGPALPQPLKRPEDAVGVLTFLAGGQGTIALKGQLVKIGKDPTSEIVVRGFWVGWTAATISRRPDGYYLSAAGGMARPRVNDKVVKHSVMLNDLDVIAIGSVKLQLSIKAPEPPAAA
jgi:pSer/pThr/pTyr-binding forkhead associated (FHA) protein